MSKFRIQWDEQRRYLKIRLDPKNVKTGTVWPHETVIRMELGDTQYEAMVPTRDLGEGNTYIPAQQVGRIDDKLVIVLPPGNDGTTYWHIPKDELHKVLVD